MAIRMPARAPDSLEVPFFRYWRVVDALAGCATADPRAYPLRCQAPAKAELCSRLMFGGGFDRVRAAVIGDRLQGKGDPVGFWIALALAAGAEQDPETRRTLAPWAGDWEREGLAPPTFSPQGSRLDALASLPGVRWQSARAYPYAPCFGIDDTHAPQLEVSATSAGEGCPYFAWLALASLVRQTASITLSHTWQERQYDIHGQLMSTSNWKTIPVLSNVDTSFSHSY